MKLDCPVVDPQTAGWNYLSFSVHELLPGSKVTHETVGEEVAIVILEGDVEVTVDDAAYEMSRDNVWTETGTVVYVPPNQRLTIEARTPSRIAKGSAPAEDVYPVRLVVPNEVRLEARGGGNARRQVAHLLSYPIEAHRLIVYEVHVPRGGWSGWPPHCHDGFAGSPYLEETYYFEFRPTDGFAFHRNYEVGGPYDEAAVAHHRQLILVPKGFHTTAACPGADMYFLNYLAGDLEHDERGRGPHFDSRYEWIEGQWDRPGLSLRVDLNDLQSSE